MTVRAHKSRALAISLGIHVSAFFGLMYLPPIDLAVPQPSPSEYQQAFAGKEDKIVWYKFKELPSITPPATPKAHRELRAEVKAKQAVVSSPKNAPKRDQVVISPVPDIELPPLDLPNLIAVKLPPKVFTTPPDVIKPAEAQIQVPDGPQEIAAQELGPVNLPTEKLPGKRFVPPPLREALPKPEIKITEVEAAPIRPLVASAIPTEKLPTRAYVPPAARPAPPRREIPAVTDVERPVATAPMVATLPSERLPSRAFVPPPKKEPAPRAEVPQPIDGPPGDVTIAIAGLNPALTATKLPAASSPAQFSAGQKVNPEGATSDGSGKGIVAADLFAHSDEKAKADLMATMLTPNRTTFSAQAQPYIEPSLPRGNGAIRVGNAPDPRFNGRDVYMLAIQMANLTSVSGDWLMWYADHDDPTHKPDVIAAPVPHRKADPKYIASAVSDHVQGRVLLYCVVDREGTVSSIELIHGIDDRLDKSAEEALAKWEFYPATRNGQPVAVDVVVEIPFSLDDPATSHLRR
jgi:TonB family protein